MIGETQDSYLLTYLNYNNAEISFMKKRREDPKSFNFWGRNKIVIILIIKKEPFRVK